MIGAPHHSQNLIGNFQAIFVFRLNKPFFARLYHINEEVSLIRIGITLTSQFTPLSMRHIAPQTRQKRFTILVLIQLVRILTNS